MDDAYYFGAISAANSLSDVNAMGGKPYSVEHRGIPSNRLPISVLREILRGAQDKASEAGIAIIGGHTVDDTEPKYGMAVTGVLHPEHLITMRVPGGRSFVAHQTDRYGHSDHCAQTGFAG